MTDYTDEERDDVETEKDGNDDDDDKYYDDDDDGNNKDSDGNGNEDVSNNESANDEAYDNPLKITASEPYRVYQSLTPKVHHVQPRFASNGTYQLLI